MGLKVKCSYKPETMRLYSVDGQTLFDLRDGSGAKIFYLIVETTEPGKFYKYGIKVTPELMTTTQDMKSLIAQFTKVFLGHLEKEDITPLMEGDDLGSGDNI